MIWMKFQYFHGLYSFLRNKLRADDKNQFFYFDLKMFLEIVVWLNLDTKYEQILKLRSQSSGIYKLHSNEWYYGNDGTEIMTDDVYHASHWSSIKFMHKHNFCLDFPMPLSFTCWTTYMCSKTCHLQPVKIVSKLAVKCGWPFSSEVKWTDTWLLETGRKWEVA